jgi:hypothetical protein
LSVHDALAVVATFQDVFHDALLWIDPHDGTGILVGQEDDLGKMGTSWPGFMRAGIARDMDEIAIRSRVVLGPAGVARYGRRGQIITDDNQLLSYGPERQREYRVPDDLMRTNMVVIGEAAAMTP